MEILSLLYAYNKYDLLLQPTTGSLTYLNDCTSILIYKVAGFNEKIKNVLILLPPGEWDGNVNIRFELTPRSSSGRTVLNSLKNSNKLTNTTTADTISSHTNGAVFLINKDIAINATLLTSHTTMATMPILKSTDDNKENLGMKSDHKPLNHKNSDPIYINITNENNHMEQNSGDIRMIIDSLDCSPITSDYDVDTDVDIKPDIKRQVLEEQTIVHYKITETEVPHSSYNVMNKFVGLVNQAMTCYLNSLVQTLFMTPEFRNAIYLWEFDNVNEKKSIAYQLQKLFLKLQTSIKSAVETTDLTRSFGWDSTEARHQHDIQELCRVMFDALERQFLKTKQANLISNLYEGKMIDYVKCLECQTEKTRADKFLDIPLSIKPFGSNVAYGSIEEALRAFVQPETLNGNNQYFCQQCNKKCDAHKGLKFSAFPYILTLHLKRFDFDYQTLAHIKLNDVLTFPETLNLNSFISEEEDKSDAFLNGGTHNPEDASAADSGNTIEEDNCSSGRTTTAGSSQTYMNGLDDEGIELSTRNQIKTHASVNNLN